MTWRRGLLPLFVAALALPLDARAQKPAKETEPGEERVERPVRFTLPAPQMQKLGVLIGTWEIGEVWEEPRRYKRGSYRGYPGQGGQGTQTIQTGPGDFSLLYDYGSNNPMGRVTAHGMISWDPAREVYVLEEVHSVFPGILHMTGRFDEGGDLVFRGEDTFTGEKRSLRRVFRGLSPQGWTQILEATEKGHRAERVWTFEFRKKELPATE